MRLRQVCRWCDNLLVSATNPCCCARPDIAIEDPPPRLRSGDTEKFRALGALYQEFESEGYRITFP